MRVSRYAVYSDARCAVCGASKTRVALCDYCESRLPFAHRWRLATARTEPWFIRWWRACCHVLRTGRGENK